MTGIPSSYRKAFWRSPHHVWLGLLTLGVGFVVAQPLVLLAGATAYVLGWIYLPDMGFFRAWVDRRKEASAQQAQEAEVSQFVRQRAQLLAALSPDNKRRYGELAKVCQEIEEANPGDPLTLSPPNDDPRLFKLDELMWTFLRLLTIQDSLERFLATEQREDLPQRIRDTEQEIAELTMEIDGRQKTDSSTQVESRQRLRDSRLELLEVLRKRLTRVEQARSNLELVGSEQERLVQQIKLLRADALAIKNTDTLTTRINATVEHLDQTNRWLAELDDYRDLVGNMPDTEKRLGFGTETPPLRSQAPAAPRTRPSLKERS